VFDSLIEPDIHVQKIRVLVADDHQQMLEYVCGLLSSDRCEVVHAVNDGQAALEGALRLRPDVVVLDISMPVMNGIQAAKHLLETNPDARIVFLTVDKDPDTCQAALQTGALGYVLKPRLGSDLIPAIRLAHSGQRFVSPGCG
jgi:DNA-binding NarL/FixJ family response regulator